MILIAFVMTPTITPAFSEVYAAGEERSATGMCGDLLLLRTLGFVATVGGAAVFGSHSPLVSWARIPMRLLKSLS